MHAFGEILETDVRKLVAEHTEENSDRREALLSVHDAVALFAVFVHNHGPDEVVLRIVLDYVFPELLDVFSVPGIGSLEPRDLIVCGRQHGSKVLVRGFNLHNR